MTASVRCRALGLLGGLALLAGTAGGAAAEPRVLGTRTVGYGSDHDSISVADGAAYSSVRLCVGNSGIQMYDFDVYFGNGGHQDASVRLMIYAGECTRWIDLSGGMRHIKRIDFTYATASSTGEQAVVTAYGR
jgi:hypothetical protein